MDIEATTCLINMSNLSDSTKAQILKTIRNCLNICNTDNVIDIYNNYDKITKAFSDKSASYKAKVFNHIKRVYENMTEEQKSQVGEFFPTGGKPAPTPTAESECEFDDNDNDPDLVIDVHDFGATNDSTCALYKIENKLQTHIEHTKEAITSIQQQLFEMQKEKKELQDIIMMFFHSASHNEGVRNVSQYAISKMFS